MSINLSSNKTITKQEAVTETVTSVTIQRIIDIPLTKKVKVKIDVFDELIELSSLSNDNYGSNWTYDSVNSAVKSYVESL